MEIFEDERTVSRADLASWLRQMADQLDSDGKVRFGAGGSVAVGDEVQCELEIGSSGSETSIEIEFSWTSTTATAPDAHADEDEEPAAIPIQEEAAEHSPPAEANVAVAAEPTYAPEEDKADEAQLSATQH